MDPIKDASMADRWIQAAHDNAMEGSTVAAKADCLAAFGAGIVSAGGAVVRGLWNSLTGKVHAQEAASLDSSRALDVIGKAVGGLFDSATLITPKDQENIKTAEQLASEILGLQRDQTVPDQAKTKLDGWLRSANTIVQKGRAEDASKELKALQEAIKELKGKPQTTDVRAIHAEWQNANKRRVRQENTDELAGMAKALFSRHKLVASSPEVGMRGRVTVGGDQNPSVPRPGNPESPPNPA